MRGHHQNQRVHQNQPKGFDYEAIQKAVAQYQQQGVQVQAANVEDAKRQYLAMQGQKQNVKVAHKQNSVQVQANNVADAKRQYLAMQGQKQNGVYVHADNVADAKRQYMAMQGQGKQVQYNAATRATPNPFSPNVFHNKTRTGFYAQTGGGSGGGGSGGGGSGGGGSGGGGSGGGGHPPRPCQEECDNGAPDCAGVCGGTSVRDCEGNCYDADTEDAPFIKDCAGVCHPRDVVPDNVPDCAGLCFGPDAKDKDGRPRPHPKFVRDCAGVCGGHAVEDCNGNCRGRAYLDCTGECVEPCRKCRPDGSGGGGSHSGPRPRGGLSSIVPREPNVNGRGRRGFTNL